jgi:hypothetical protein
MEAHELERFSSPRTTQHGICQDSGYSVFEFSREKSAVIGTP